MEDGIEIKGVYERSDGKYRDQEGMERVKEFIGEPLTQMFLLWRMVSDILLM